MSIQLVLTRDLLVVMEGDLGVPAEQSSPMSARDGDEPALAGFGKGASCPDPVEEAAVYGAWIIRHQLFPKNNREIGYEVMRQMLEGAERPWPRPHEDAPAIEAMMEALEAGTISEAKFVDWVRLRVATA